LSHFPGFARYSARALLAALVVLFGLLAFRPLTAAPAADGEGVMTVDPTVVTYGTATNTFTFTFSATLGDFGPGSQVALTIPPGWTPPTAAAGPGHVAVDSGTATLSGSPPFGITGPMVFIDLTSCRAGEFFTVTYSGVTPPPPAGSPYAFVTQTDIGPGGEGLVNTTAAFPAVVIDPATLTISAAALTPDPKVYDGTVTASLTIGAPTLEGVVGADAVSLVTSGAAAAFDDKNVGPAKLVTILGLTLAGADAANYVLAPPTRTGSITPRPITVTAVPETRAYDGTTGAIGLPILAAGTPLAPGDVEPVWTQTFDNRNAGAGKLLTPAGAVVDGNDGMNYTYGFVPVPGGEITTLGITVTAVADSRVYDGTTSSIGVPNLSATTPLAPGDAEPAWVQTFDTPNAGPAKALTPSGRVIDGNGGLNYAYDFITVTDGSISPQPLSVTANTAAKTYGAADPTFTASYSGFVNGESEAVLSGTLSFSRAPGESVGEYAITPGGLTSSNYTIAFNPGALSITPAALTVSADAKTKVYGAADPAFTASYGGFVNGETEAVLSGTLSFSRAPGESVGEYAITPGGLTSSNYAIAFNAGTLTITPPTPSLRPLTFLNATDVVISWSAVSNVAYRVEYKLDLSAGNWTGLSGDVTATSDTASKQDTLTGTSRFYRVRLLP
jgi:hypothetical protein